MRVFSFVGSLRGEMSHTKQISDRLAEALKGKAEQAGLDFSYECMTGEGLRVDYCRGCTSCFRKGVCPLDGEDDMPRLKEKLREADVIFFGSPVYIWEMSGLCKSVLDRIAYWTHDLELAGRVGIIITSTDTGHGEEVAENLRTLLKFTGMAMAESLVLKNHASPRLDEPEEAEPLLDRAAEELMGALRDPGRLIDRDQEAHWATRLLTAREALF